MGKPTVGFEFFELFPSDRNHKATKDCNVHFFIHSSDSCKLYQRIPGTLRSYYIQVYHSQLTSNWFFFSISKPLRITDTVQSLAHITKHQICSFATFSKFSKQRERNRLFELSAKYDLRLFLTDDVGGAGIGLMCYKSTTLINNTERNRPLARRKSRKKDSIRRDHKEGHEGA